MLEGPREFLKSGNGKIIAIVVLVVGILLAGYMILRPTGESELIALSRSRVFIDADTGQTFSHTLSVGEEYPVKAPSGKNSGYIAEQCFWTKDGKSKESPTYVVLNVWKGSSEPTFCPDCQRLVVGKNPKPAGPTSKAPPTKSEYKPAR